ncbi:hypothetical protein FAGAP_7970 [Fusarium agapanthi]|uniref:Uncharacterized protein n=1 Tax=Fusarium agapanthi TaxID=1803897 RepID=A0A9P5ECE4_9HYPO|nr:hypothetical protein FAGAP_7970 [Fusarium agapanthi]
MPHFRLAHFEYAGESTGDSISSADWDSDFVYGVVSRFMLGPLDELLESMMPLVDDCKLDHRSKADPGYTNPEQSLKDQIDDLLAILRDIRSFVMHVFPGAGRVIIVSLFSLLQKRISTPCALAGAFATHVRAQIDVGSPVHTF